MKKNIAVIFGGKSAEHDVSILTAYNPIIPAIKTIGIYNIIPIYITKEGQWYSEQQMLDIKYFKNPEINDELKKNKKIRLLFDNGLKIIKPGFREKIIKIDIVFPAMHGTFGEDGSLMGLLRMADVPFVGCDIFASAASMDKAMTKQILLAEKIPIVPYVWLTKYEWQNKKEKILAKVSELKKPVFVKPVHLGSSIAITKAEEQKDMENAVEVAFHYDNKIIIEEAVSNLVEVTLPIMGNEILTTGKVEKPLNKSDFFNFSDKYLSGNKKGHNTFQNYSQIPAKIKKELAKKVISLGEKAYKVLNCTGIARIDFLIDEKNEIVYINEVNTLPGSLYNHNWNEAGISNSELVKKLIKLAEELYAKNKEIVYSFKSDILKNVKGNKFQ